MIETQSLHPALAATLPIKGLSKPFSVPARMFLNLVESKAGLGTWSFDARTRAMTLSSRARMMFGFDETTPLPSLAGALSLAHADDHETILSALGLLSSGISQSFEFRLVGEGGDLRWISVVACASLTHADALECVFGFAHDITETRRSLKAVEDSERRARQVADAHGLKTWVSADSILVDPKQFASRMTDVARDVVDQVHPDDRSSPRKRFSKPDGTRSRSS